MADQDQTAPLGPNEGVRLEPEAPAVRFPEVTPVDPSTTDQTAAEAMLVDATVVDPKQAAASPNQTVIDQPVILPRFEVTRPERAAASTEVDTDAIPAPHPTFFDTEPPRPLELATEHLPVPTTAELHAAAPPTMVEPREKAHPPPPLLPKARPELRTEDLPVVVPSPGLSPRENSRPESGWVAFATPTEVEPLARPGDRRPDALPSVSTLEPEPTYVRPMSVPTVANVPSATEKQAAPAVVRAPVAKPAEAPSARRGPGPGARLKEIVRPAPFDPDVPDTPASPPEPERPTPGRAQGTPGPRQSPARATPTPGPKEPGVGLGPPPEERSRPIDVAFGPSAPGAGVSPTGPTIHPPAPPRSSSWKPLVLTVLAALLFGVLLGHFLARAGGAAAGPSGATPSPRPPPP